VLLLRREPIPAGALEVEGDPAALDRFVAAFSQGAG
jgi:hypothetical protein